MLGKLPSNPLQSRNSMSVLLIISALLAGAVASLIAYSIFHQRSNDAVHSLPIEQSIDFVTALGYLTPQSEIVHLSAPTSNQRLMELRVEEGDRVEVGQIIAVMDNLPEYQASVDSAIAKVRVAQARLLNVQVGEESGVIEAQQRIIARLEAQLAGDVAMQQAVLARKRMELAHAESEYQRYQSLTEAGAISVENTNSKQLQVEVARAELQEAEAQLDKIKTTGQEQIEEAQATLNSLASVRPTDVSVAQAELNDALSQLHQAEVALDSVYVRSPLAGQILRLNTKVSEVVGANGIAEIGTTQQMYVIAEVYVSDRQYVHVDQRATIVSDYGGFTGDLEGVVETIDLQIANPAVVSNNPADKTDVRVVKVKIRLNPEDSKRVETLNNLEVRASIQIDPSVATN